MRTKFIKLFGVALVLGLLVVGAAPGLGAQPPGLARKIVVLSPDAVNEVARAQIERLGTVVIEKEIATPRGTLLVVLLPEPASRAVNQIAGVLRVEDDAVVYALAEVKPWGVDRIDADLVWPRGNTGNGVKVAIIDTGISKTHPDLVGNLKGGVNFVKQRGTVDPSMWDDDNGHGSHVAGIVAAVDNEIGVVGVAPQAYLYAVKVLNRQGMGYLSDVIDGIYWAKNNGMQVINMSLGCDCPSDTLKQAVDAAYGSGIVVVAAAGNSGNAAGTGDTVIYPAKYDSVIAVAATSSTDTRASWSSTGPAVELAAPGVSIYSTWKGTGYYTASGTSMASPHVAGAAALVIASGRAVDSDGSYGIANEVRVLLTSTADDLGDAGWDSKYGWGLLDAQEAATGTQTLP